MVSTTDDHEYRPEAELTDDGELLPPTVGGREHVPEAVAEAVDRALAEHPNAIRDARFAAADRGADADLIYYANERPVVGPDGVTGWLPPYRSREVFAEELREALPDGWRIELERRGRLGFYEP